MGDYLNFIRDMPIDGKIGRRVVARLATYRALGITRVDPEEVAKQAVWDEINAMPAVRRYHGEYVPQEPQDIRSSVAPVMAAPVAKSERVITLPSRVTVKASEQPAPTLINVTCPQCGREKPINPQRSNRSKMRGVAGLLKQNARTAARHSRLNYRQNQNRCNRAMVIWAAGSTCPKPKRRVIRGDSMKRLHIVTDRAGVHVMTIRRGKVRRYGHLTPSSLQRARCIVRAEINKAA